jgi:hypothetical protein
MRAVQSLLLAAAMIAGAVPSANGLDMVHVTCRAFLASGHDNMAAIIMWLRGYHAGKSGVIAATDVANMRAYGGRLGRYCKEHPDENAIDASEKILADEDHGI